MPLEGNSSFPSCYSSVGLLWNSAYQLLWLYSPPGNSCFTQVIVTFCHQPVQVGFGAWVLDPDFFTSKPRFLQPGLILSCPEKCTCSILSIVREYSLYHRCAISIFYPVHTSIAAQNEPALLDLPREILYIHKYPAHMSLPPRNISRFSSQEQILPSSILTMLLSLHFYPASFYIIHCLTISSVYLFLFKFWYLSSLRIGVRAYLYFVSYRMPRNIRP